MTRTQMELAGLFEANDSAGRKVDSGYLKRPEWAQIERDKLHWKAGFMGVRVLKALVKPPIDLLDRFIRLSDADDAEILRFAKSYGTLRRPQFHGRRLRKSDFEARE